MRRDCDKAAVKRYKARYIKRYYFEVNRRTDADIIAFLDACENRNGTLKAIVREAAENS